MDEKELDISLPDEAADSSDVSRREAISQARAIRREAAAKEESEKQQAAAEANAILKNAENDPTVQRDFQDNTVSLMFTQLRTPITSAHPAHVQEEKDADSIVAEIMAEVTGKQPVSGNTSSYTGRSSDPDTDALVNQIIAEVTAKKDPARRSSDALVDQIIAETAQGSAAESEEEPAEEDFSEDALYEEEPEPEEDPVTAATDAAIAAGDEDAITEAVKQIAERAAQLTKKEPEPEPAAKKAPPVLEKKPEPVKKTDPLAAAFAAEDFFTRERQRAIDHSEEMEEAAEQYAEDTAGAKRAVKKLTRQSDRTWQREAAREQAKRHSGRSSKIAAAVNLTVCAALFFGIAIGMVVFERPTMSEEENRMLATMPDFSTEDYINGKYTAGVAEYYNDTVPFRSVFKNLTADFRQHLGLQSDVVLHGNASVVQDNPEPEVTEPAVTTAPAFDPDMIVTTTQAAETTAPTETELAVKEEEGDGELSNSILIYQKRAISLFQAGETAGKAYAGYLNNYQEDLGSSVQVYSLVAPTACSFYTPEKFQKMCTSEEANINYINSCFEGVKPVDAYSALAKHTDEPIFMRTDHHWGSIGAFYAAEEFAKTARVPFARISDYEKVVKPGYVGTMYGYSGDKTIKDNPEDFIYYIPKAQFKTTYFNRSVQNGYEGKFFMNIDKTAAVSWYMVYMSGDDHVVRLNTEVKNGRRLVVIKDSYGNALIPWLTSSFEQIDVIDMRYFNKNAISYIKEVGATDVLFAMNSFSANSGNGRKVETIRKQ